MFCPNCKSEYLIGVRACADCHVPLVPELPASPDAHDSQEGLQRPSLWLEKRGRLLLSQPDPSSLESDDLVEVFSTERTGDLAAAQSILKAHGIEHFTAGFEQPNSHCHATPQKWVMVRREELNEAKRALNDLLTIAHRERQRTEEEFYMKAGAFEVVILLLGFFLMLLVMGALGVRWP